MNELLKVEINANNEQVINGRMLYEFLQMKKFHIQCGLIE